MRSLRGREVFDPVRITPERTILLALLAVSLVLLFQAYELDRWTFLGPGPGLFPLIATGLCAAMALLLLALPRLAGPVKADDEPVGPTEKRLFWLTAISLPFLAIGAAYLGFIALSVIVAFVVAWGGERRGWKATLVFGVACGVVGVIGFGHFLGAQLPTTALERAVLSLVQ